MGIDPGYAILGYGVLDMKGNKFEVIAYGSILTDNSMEMPQRLKLLYDELSEIIRRYQPEEASIEELFFNNNAKTAILVGEARGRMILPTRWQQPSVTDTQAAISAPFAFAAGFKPCAASPKEVQ